MDYDDLDYERDVETDPMELDVGWLKQAPLGLKYGRHLTKLKDKVRRLEEKKKTTRSELIREANKNPEKCCNKKSPNAGDLEAYYRTSPVYMEVIEELNSAIAEMEMAEIAKNEICWTRRSTLENMVTLHGQQYFAGPRVPRDIGKEWSKNQEVRQKKVDSGINTALKRRKG